MKNEVCKPLAHKHGSPIERIGDQFSKAAMDYQRYNVLQRLVAQRLKQGMPLKGRLLDIGSGQGTDFLSNNGVTNNESSDSGISEVVAVDIAQKMLQQLRRNYPQYSAIYGDAQALPIQTNSIDVIYSNLALQWCSNLSLAIAEMTRVLTLGGECHLTLVADGSLSELNQLGFRINKFNTVDEVSRRFDRDRWQLEQIKLDPITVYFKDLTALLYSIKGVGAAVKGSVDSDREGRYLRGRQDWQALQTQAETMRCSKGLPLSYNILFIRARLLE